MNELAELASLRDDIAGRRPEDLTRAREMLNAGIRSAGRSHSPWRSHGGRACVGFDTLRHHTLAKQIFPCKSALAGFSRMRPVRPMAALSSLLPRGAGNGVCRTAKPTVAGHGRADGARSLAPACLHAATRLGTACADSVL